MPPRMAIAISEKTIVAMMMSASSSAASIRVPTPARGKVIVTCSGVVIRTASGVSAVVVGGGRRNGPNPPTPFPTGEGGEKRTSGIIVGLGVGGEEAVVGGGEGGMGEEVRAAGAGAEER